MRQWAISIGINQYQFFQPLSYAQPDAQAVQTFLLEDVGIPAEQCLLLTETSPTQWGRATYPDRNNIQSWLDLLTQQCLEPGDVLWFFFSGYGVCQQGQDYLLPIEGDPTAISTTALPLEVLFRSLRRVEMTALVLLDMNRNESSSHETVGTHTAHLASITGIPTILSCKPEQFSRETSALGHGFFTAALLEGLRSRRCKTVAALDHYLSDHLPELSEHYWRPLQQAVTLCPDEKRQQSLFLSPATFADQGDDRDRHFAPQAGLAKEANGTAVPTATNRGSSAGNYSPLVSSTYGNGNGVAAATVAMAEPATTFSTSNGRPGTANGGTITADSDAYAYSSLSTGSHSSTNGSAYGGNGFTVPTQTNGLRANGLGSNGLRAEHTLDSALQNHENGVAQYAQVATVQQPPSDPPDDANDIPDALFWRPVLQWGSLVVVGLIAGVLLRNCAAFTPKAPSTALNAASSGVGQPSVGSSGVTALPAVKAVSPALSSSPTAIKTLSPQPIASSQGFGVSGASRLNLSTGSAGATVQSQLTQPAMPAKVPMPSPLVKARALASINSNQASPYWYAIRAARAMQPGQPDYAQAQQEIAVWSRKIMSIARQRGRQGSYDAAIVAARLVPQDQPGYTEAKSAIAGWCPLLKSQRGANPVQRQQARNACL